MIISTIYSIWTAPSCEEKTIICCSFLVEKVSSSITNIKFRITSGQSSFLVLLVFRADILAIPEVILLISFFICIIISKRCLNLLPGCSFLRISKSQILFFLLLDKLLRNMFIDIEFWFCNCLKRREISLNPLMQLLRQGPYRLVGLSIKVVIFLLMLIVKDLKRLNKLIDFFGIHLFSFKYYRWD